MIWSQLVVEDFKKWLPRDWKIVETPNGSRFVQCPNGHKATLRVTSLKRLVTDIFCEECKIWIRFKRDYTNIIGIEVEILSDEDFRKRLQER
ncbi:MAG TPA: hypothetical protein ENG16_05445 [Archaeoglobus sp.]|nr:hypothetical protein [Archaeoglobus sp.]